MEVYGSARYSSENHVYIFFFGKQALRGFQIWHLETKFHPIKHPLKSFSFSLIKVAFRFGHSQVQHEFRPYINGTIAIFPRDSDTVNDHSIWLLSTNYFQIGGNNSFKFIIGQGGKSWLNEIEGLIKQKCPEADLRVENALTNELFAEGLNPRGERISFWGLTWILAGPCKSQLCISDWNTWDYHFLHPWTTSCSKI